MAQGIHVAITGDATSFNAAAKSAETAADGMRKSMGRNRQVMQQAGYQIGDFAVQVQGGTNALVAFGQQASQMAGAFGPGGAVLGAVIAITSAVAGGLINSFKGAKDETKDWRKETTKLADSLYSLSFLETQQTLLGLNEQIEASKELIKQLKIRVSGARAYGATNKENLKLLKEEEARLIELQGNYKTLNAIAGRRIVERGEQARFEQEQEKAKTEEEAKKKKRVPRFKVEEDLFLTHMRLMEEYKAEQEQAEIDRQTRITDYHQMMAERRISIEKQAAQAMAGVQGNLWSNAANLLSVFGKKNKAAALASIAISKGLAMAQTWQQTQTASMLAFASQLIPGDPTSIARAEAARNATLLQGKISMALIAATGLAQAAGGGGGGGGGGGAAGAAAAAAGGSQQGPENQIVNIDLQGEVFGREQVRGLIGQINDALDDGYTLRV